MADEATIVARACDKARAGLRLSLVEQRAVARAVLARVEEMEGEKAEEEKTEEEEEVEVEEEEGKKKKKKPKKKKKAKHLVGAATEKMENLGVGVGMEAAGGEDLVPSRTKAEKKEHACGVAVLGGLGELELGGGSGGGGEGEVVVEEEAEDEDEEEEL